jgi:hypothetical protein
VSYWPLAGTMLILMAGSFECGEPSSACGVKVWYSGRLTQGVSPRVVMDVLGHSQLSITMDLYSHVMPSALRDAADAMDRALTDDR